MRYYLEAFGIKQAQTRFERMGVAAIAATPAMQTIARRLMQIIDETFESQGRRGGGSWAGLSDEWLLRKQRLGLDPRIQHATLALRHSMTIEGDENQDLHVGRYIARVGSTLPYADTAQQHRPFVKLTKKDKVELRMIIRNWLIAAWRLRV